LGHGYENVAGALAVVSTVATVVTCSMAWFEPVINSMLVLVHFPVGSGVQRISQVVPTWPSGGVRGVGCATTTTASGVNAANRSDKRVEEYIIFTLDEVE